MRYKVKLDEEMKKDIEYKREIRQAVKDVDKDFDNHIKKNRMSIHTYLWKEKVKYADKLHKQRLQAIKEAAKWRSM